MLVWIKDTTMRMIGGDWVCDGCSKRKLLFVQIGSDLKPPPCRICSECVGRMWRVVIFGSEESQTNYVDCPTCNVTQPVVTASPKLTEAIADQRLLADVEQKPDENSDTDSGMDSQL